MSAVTTYTCDPGFTLLGDSTRECGIDEVWTNSEPSCASKGNGQDCSKQFGSGPATLCSDNNHTHFAYSLVRVPLGRTCPLGCYGPEWSTCSLALWHTNYVHSGWHCRDIFVLWLGACLRLTTTLVIIIEMF